MGDVVQGHKFRQLVEVPGEVDFAGHDRIEPALDDLPYRVENPGGLVDEDDA